MESYSLPIHFEILDNKHEVSSVTLNTFIESYKEIFEELFEQKIEIKIGLAEEGGWLNNLILIFSTIIITPYLEGILNLDKLKEIGTTHNERVIKSINKFISEEATKTSDGYPKKCIEQKNKIYQRFQDDDCITAFDLDKCPPIPRSNFNLYIKELPEEEDLYVGKAKISVNSPNWKLASKRSWQGEVDILDNKQVAFDFDKDLTGRFWEKIKLNDIVPTTGSDIMEAQLIKRLNKNPQHRVIRVLSYNQKEIDSPLSDEDISKITSGVINDIENNNNPQMDLFNDYQNKE